MIFFLLLQTLVFLNAMTCCYTVAAFQKVELKNMKGWMLVLDHKHHEVTPHTSTEQTGIQVITLTV